MRDSSISLSRPSTCSSLDSTLVALRALLDLLNVLVLRQRRPHTVHLGEYGTCCTHVVDYIYTPIATSLTHPYLRARPLYLGASFKVAYCDFPKVAFTRIHVSKNLDTAHLARPRPNAQPRLSFNLVSTAFSYTTCGIAVQGTTVSANSATSPAGLYTASVDVRVSSYSSCILARGVHPPRHESGADSFIRNRLRRTVNHARCSLVRMRQSSGEAVSVVRRTHLARTLVSMINSALVTTVALPPSPPCAHACVLVRTSRTALGLFS